MRPAPDAVAPSTLVIRPRRLRLVAAAFAVALVLVGAEGVSYEEAATIMGCKVGTVKSRVSRARGRLAELLGYDEERITDLVIAGALG